MNELWVKVNRPIGYHDHHNVGEIIKIFMRDANDLIRNGFVEILVNNNGNNLPYDEKEFRTTENF